jgi:predicted nucleic acid-binding protein
VKLAVPEPETRALSQALRRWPARVSSVFSRVEMHRAIRRSGEDRWLSHAGDVLDRITELDVSASLLHRASELDPPRLRSLDAIHLATALMLGDDLDALVAYDRRLIAAARSAGLEVVTPA